MRTAAKVLIILSSAALVLWACKSTQDIVLLFAGGFFRAFFSEHVYDPIFRDQSAQGWLVSLFKRKSKYNI